MQLLTPFPGVLNVKLRSIRLSANWTELSHTWSAVHRFCQYLVVQRGPGRAHPTEARMQRPRKLQVRLGTLLSRLHQGPQPQHLKRSARLARNVVLEHL